MLMNPRRFRTARNHSQQWMNAIAATVLAALLPWTNARTASPVATPLAASAGEEAKGTLAFADAEAGPVGLCSAPEGGATCDGGGPATQEGGAGGGVDVGVGNPVNLVDGNKYQREVDLAALPGVLGVEIVRHYNSASSSRKGLLGRGWRLSYETTLQRSSTGVLIIQADGSRLHFVPDPARPGRYTAVERSAGWLETGADAAGMRWHWTHGAGAGRQLDFDRAGRLTRILAPGGEFLSLLYDGRGLLRKVIDPQGRTLELHYPERAQARAQGRYAGVSRIVSPLGTHHYAYGNSEASPAHPQQLHSVTQRLEGGPLLIRRYHHEDPRGLLTGISQEVRTPDGRVSSRRLSSYAYDATGRALESRFALPSPAGADRAEPRRERIRLEYRAQPRPGKPGLTVVSDEHGRLTSYRTARIARALRVLEVRGAGCLRCGPVNVRYRYDDAGRLQEVVKLDAGHGTAQNGRRFVHDSLGRVQRIEALHYRAGQLIGTTLLQGREYADDSTRPTLIEHPSVVAGRSHRLQLRYNDHGQVIEVHESGFSPLDDEGRPTPAGTPIERTTRYRYRHINGRSLLSEIDGPLANGMTNTPADSDITRYQYDPDGHHVQAIHHPAQLSEHFERDRAGRIIAHTPLDGVTIRYRLDHQGQPLHWQRAQAEMEISRDAYGRAMRIVMPDGRVRRLDQESPGSATPAGGTHGYVALAAAPSSPAPDAPQGGAHLAGHWPGQQDWVDDFGRLCARRTDASGFEHRRHDAAGHLLERHFADGVVWRWQRDAAGRILSLAVQRTGTERPTMTRLEWSGPRLVRIEHPDEIETRSHDASGRIIRRRIERPQGLPQRPQVLHYEEAYAYDHADRLIRHQLPEGGELRYRWGQGAQLLGIDWVDALHRLTPLIAPLTAETEAGHGGYRYGNGIEMRMSLDPLGRLQQLEHRLPAHKPEIWPDWITAAHADDTGAAALDERVIEGWRYGHDEARRLAWRQNLRLPRTEHFGFDAASRLIYVRTRGEDMAPKSEFYAYDSDDQLLGRQLEARNEDLRLQAPLRNAGGLPSTQFAPQPGQSLLLQYAASRRLTTVLQGAAGEPLRPLARYEYNAFGLRTRKTVFGPESAHNSTQYLWHQHRLAAEVRERPGAAPTLSRRHVYAHGVPVATIDYPAGRALSLHRPPWQQTVLALWDRMRGQAPRLHFVHANEIGAPVAVTDPRRRVVWRAAYQAYGSARIDTATAAAQAYTLNLRLPGQYFDAETGWHDNVMRSYDPRRGEYLEPDPLGPQALTRPHAYAAHNPLMLADPLGLVLFAFDGTGNDRESNTNVLLFAEQYDDLNEFDVFKEYKGTQFYSPGVGTRGGLLDNVVTGGGLALGLRERIDEQLNNLDTYVRERTDYHFRQADPGRFTASDPLRFDIDIVGYSRGAAAARDFANRIAELDAAGHYQELSGQACIDIRLRFLGLFDTVLGVHWGSFELSIPDAVMQVSHAVARNEHRPLFELESILGTPASSASNRLERSFVGAHADIGGGYNCAGAECDAARGDLSDIALQWMVQQARAAGVKMNALPADLRTVSQPVLHAETNNDPYADGSGPYGEAQTDLYAGERDRLVDFAAGGKLRSKLAPLPALSFERSLDFITFDRQPASPPQYQGRVDLTAYSAWLNEHYALGLSP